VPLIGVCVASEPKLGRAILQGEVGHCRIGDDDEWTVRVPESSVLVYGLAQAPCPGERVVPRGHNPLGPLPQVSNQDDQRLDGLVLISSLRVHDLDDEGVEVHILEQELRLCEGWGLEDVGWHDSQKHFCRNGTYSHFTPWL